MERAESVHEIAPRAQQETEFLEARMRAFEEVAIRFGPRVVVLPASGGRDVSGPGESPFRSIDVVV
jgi:hypothetical protein